MNTIIYLIKITLPHYIPRLLVYAYVFMVKMTEVNSKNVVADDTAVNVVVSNTNSDVKTTSSITTSDKKAVATEQFDEDGVIILPRLQ